MFLNALVVLVVLGFPPIREIRENFEEFSSQGNQGTTGGFQPKLGEKISNYGTFFFSKSFSNILI